MGTGNRQSEGLGGYEVDLTRRAVLLGAFSGLVLLAAACSEGPGFERTHYAKVNDKFGTELLLQDLVRIVPACLMVLGEDGLARLRAVNPVAKLNSRGGLVGIAGVSRSSLEELQYDLSNFRVKFVGDPAKVPKRALDNTLLDASGVPPDNAGVRGENTVQMVACKGTTIVRLGDGTKIEAVTSGEEYVDREIPVESVMDAKVIGLSFGGDGLPPEISASMTVGMQVLPVVLL
jgi:hypothetical protein